ncbi:MAG: GNAT family N-acetyltransferase [Dokdonella sp.]|uniref:GNAT family N-acetyltransferase n=1 Tax=Dokdonella sp. TaxID=2291710 RepID=UPI0032630DED
MSDAPELSVFAERCYRDTFASANTTADLEAFVAATYSLTLQETELANAAIITLLGHANESPIAFAQLRLGTPPECVDANDSIELQRFYVCRAAQGCGVANELMAAVVSTVRALRSNVLWLGVWEHNARAMAFYRRHGFADVGSHVFRMGSDGQIDRIDVRTL